MKSKGGRPRKEIDKTRFEKLCNIMCTLGEIAGVFDCSEDTVERWCERTYEQGFADTYKKHSASGKMSLRRIQFRMAEKNPAMAIWLGKQYLGQQDRLALDVNKLDSEIDRELAKLGAGSQSTATREAEESIH